jgi:hypothetical protein
MVKAYVFDLSSNKFFVFAARTALCPGLTTNEAMPPVNTAKASKSQI